MKISVTKDVVGMFRQYRRMPDNGAWGSLHIAMDDGNMDDNSIQFCYARAMERGDGCAVALASILMAMSKTQRRKIYHVANKED